MFVGGCVRKFLTNDEINDIDIATSLTPSEVIKKFTGSEFEIKKTGIEHGTLTLVKGKETFEITTLREDVSTDGRHAKVLFSNDWKKDSERRDFTINAIYMSSNGKIFDPQNGVNDLKNKKVNFIGDANLRIQEDYLRILRYLRFSLQYDNEFDEKTIKNIKLNLSGFNSLSKERVYDELLKILDLENFQKKIISNSHLIEIFNILFPEFKYIDRLKKNKNILIKKISKDMILAILTIDETNNHEYFCYKYNVSNKFREKLHDLSSGISALNKDKNFFKQKIKKNLYLHGKELMRDLNLLSYFKDQNKNQKNYFKISEDINNISIPKFPYDGKFLLKKGFSEGKNIGKIIKEIEIKWIDNEFKLNDEQLGILLKKYD